MVQRTLLPEPAAWRCSNSLSTTDVGQVFALRKSRPKGWLYSEALYAARQVAVLRDDHDDLIAGLRAIVERADNGELGSSKVQDMRRLAADLLAKHGATQ